MNTQRAHAAFRRITAPLFAPLRARLDEMRWRRLYGQNGIEGLAMLLRSGTRGQAEVLRQFGAHIGADCRIAGPLHVVNAEGDFANLWIGDHVRFGPSVLIDLSERVTVENEATVSPRVALLTAAEPREHRSAGPIRIGAGAHLGTASTVMPGVTIREQALVQATAVVIRDVAAHETVTALPAMQLAGR